MPDHEPPEITGGSARNASGYGCIDAGRIADQHRDPGAADRAREGRDGRENVRRGPARTGKADREPAGPRGAGGKTRGRAEGHRDNGGDHAAPPATTGHDTGHHQGDAGTNTGGATGAGRATGADASGAGPWTGTDTAQAPAAMARMMHPRQAAGSLPDHARANWLATRSELNTAETTQPDAALTDGRTGEARR